MRYLIDILFDTFVCGQVPLHALENAQTTGRPATVRENHRALPEGARMLYFATKKPGRLSSLSCVDGRMAIAASEAQIRAFE